MRKVKQALVLLKSVKLAPSQLYLFFFFLTKKRNGKVNNFVARN